ncbi:MAG: (2Fe-2S)-binding protein [Bacillota bacterium]
MDDNTIICRCEDVTLGEVRRLLRAGYTTVDEIKRISRCGMGPCQGRTCRQLIAREVAGFTGKSLEEVLMPTFRPPTKPVKLAAVARGEIHEE